MQNARECILLLNSRFCKHFFLLQGKKRNKKRYQSAYVCVCGRITNCKAVGVMLTSATTAANIKHHRDGLREILCWWRSLCVKQKKSKVAHTHTNYHCDWCWCLSLPTSVIATFLPTSISGTLKTPNWDKKMSLHTERQGSLSQTTTVGTV